LFGRGGEEAEALGDAGSPSRCPGVTSAIGALAYAGSRDPSRVSTAVTSPRPVGDPTRPACGLESWAAGGTVVVLMGMANREEIAGASSRRRAG